MRPGPDGCEEDDGKQQEISIDSYIDESADAKVLEDVVADYVIESSDSAP